MKSRNRRAMWCLLSAMSISMLAGASAMADEDEIRDKIAIPYEQENAWEEVAMVNDDVVETGVYIRATADPEGEVLGYLYYGMAAWVIEKGDEWTEINSGDITGFVKNEYLLYGRDVIGLADHYGYEGVLTTWDDVNLFSAGDADSVILDVLETGEYFILLEDAGHWLTVQVGNDSIAYVSSEDVSRALILDTAVDKDGLYEGNDLIPMIFDGEWKQKETEAPETDWSQPETDAPETEWKQPETEWQPPQTEWQPPQTEWQPPQTEWQPPQTEWQPPQTETNPPQTETNPPQTETDPPQTNPPQTEPPQTNPPQTETNPPETEAPWNGDDGGWYDADTDTYYDADGNIIYPRNTTESEMPEETAPDFWS